MVLYRPENQVPGNGIEERPDIHVDYPVVLPAPPTSLCYRMQCRPPRPVPVGIRVEYRLCCRPAPCRLLSALSDRPPSEPLAFWFRQLSLRISYPAHRRREVSSRREPVPELVEIPFQVLLELGNRLPVNPGRTFIGSNLPVCLPHQPLEGYQMASASGHSLVPPVFRLTRDCPADSPSPSLRYHYSSLITTTGRSAPVPWTGTLPLTVPAACGTLLHPAPSGTGIPGRRVLLFPQEPESCSRPLHAGCRRGSKQVSPRLIPGPHTFSWFRHHLKHFDASTRVRFHSPSRSAPDAVFAASFPRRSPPRLLTGAARGGLLPPSCSATAEGLPPSLAQHRQPTDRTYATS